MKLKYFWHIHHNNLCEPLIEPLENRIRYIKQEKPEDERELRLRLLKPVKGKLPMAWVKADQARVKACQVWDKVCQAWFETCHALAKAYQACLPQLKKLHKKECGCGYDFERQTIFSKENGLEK